MADMCEWRASGRAVGEQWRRDNSKKRRVAREQAPARLTGQRVSTPQDGGLITAKLAQAGGSRFCQEHLLACKKLSSLRQSRRRYAFASTTSIARDLALVLFRDFHRHRFHALDSIACDLALCPSLQSPSIPSLSIALFILRALSQPRAYIALHRQCSHCPRFHPCHATTTQSDV